MASIYQMPTHLSNLIAAGEVVERPASVAKELVENAIDAGADRIEVELRQGGIAYLRVTDNGCGMDPEDARIAFLRHATSKLHSEEELTAIGTLGFRGEALAAIASVSRISLRTKTAQAQTGTALQLTAGQVEQEEEQACLDGTTILVRDLFFNTPARMKFLKKDATEAGYVCAAVEKAALCHPEIGFSCIKDGKDVFQTPGNGDLGQTIHCIYGRTFLRDMERLPPFTLGEVQVSGYVGKPHAAKGSRTYQMFCVNGRPVRSGLLQAALEQAYRHCVMTGKFPYCVLQIDLPLSQVDINVHPAKTEVKFMQEKAVFDAVYAAVKNLLEQTVNRPEVRLPQSAPVQIQAAKPEEPAADPPAVSPPPSAARAEQLHWSLPSAPAPVKPQPPHRLPWIECEREDAEELADIKPSAFASARFDQPPPPVERQPAPAVVDPAAGHAASKTAVSAEPERDVRYLGECFSTYLLVEQGDKLLLIDKHAAHERILFNQLERADMPVPAQTLLTPLICRLSAGEMAAVQENQQALQQLGYFAEPFGERDVLIRQAPAYVAEDQVAATLEMLAAQLDQKQNPTLWQRDELLHSIACKGAIKAGFLSPEGEMQALAKRVLSDPSLLSCPHGRPVVVELTRKEIEKFFQRIPSTGGAAWHSDRT